jgi:hypothetical protein
MRKEIEQYALCELEPVFQCFCISFLRASILLLALSVARYHQESTSGVVSASCMAGCIQDTVRIQVLRVMISTVRFLNKIIYTYFLPLHCI